VYRLTDVALYPNADAYANVPLDDPTNSQAQVMGLLHSTTAINDLDVPLNGWQFTHPAGITKVSHYGITALTGQNSNADNVLRVVASDQSRRPEIVWGQTYLTPMGPIYYATQASPRVDTLVPSRLNIQFQINASVPSDPINGDGSFAAIQGVTCYLNPQYCVGFTYGPTQQFYDLNCNITQNTPNDGDVITVATNLEKGATLQIDCVNKLVWHFDSAGVQTLRSAAIILDSARNYWLKLHPGDNPLVYTEDVVGSVLMTVAWNDNWQ